MLKFKTVNSVFFSILLVLLIISFIYGFHYLPFIIIGIIWFSITATGSFKIGWNYHIESLNSNPEIEPNQIAITFDDGPNPEFTPQVLELLQQYKAKATFFCIGKHIESHPKLFKKIIDHGHTVGNHTYSHDNNFGFFKTDKVISELQKTKSLVKQQTGLSIRLYRPAFGVTNPRIKRALKITKLQSIGWNNRSFDTTSLDEKSILKRITKNIKKGDVILLHDTSAKTIAVLEQLLLFLREQNIDSVTVDSLFNIQAYA